MVKNVFKVAALVIISFLLGMICYRNNWFPRPQIQSIKNYYIPSPNINHLVNYQDKLILPYSKGTPLFSDRTYYDTAGAIGLENTYVIQIPRHYTGTTRIKLIDSTIVFRLVSNLELFDDWSLTNIKVSIAGKSLTHNSVVSKNYGPGIIELKNPNTVAATPILIKVKNDSVGYKADPFEILNAFKNS